ncbi:diacylglycerol kinase [Actinopolymorpha sp. B17G11]|uniref:diacylglycerol kinase n=1 Tax=Actinopolymorpha sp. B17G11 TaxID=3160861 RepID=UPI0032E51A6F
MDREIVVLVNPTSGRGRGARLADPVTERLREAGLNARWEAGRDAAESVDLARRAVARGVDGLVIIGGDGMIHLALDAVAETDTPLAVIPAGTGNDLARSLGIPVRDPLAAADIVVAGHTRSQDLGRVVRVDAEPADDASHPAARHSASGWFATVLCAGFDSRVAERVNRMTWPHGRLRYDLATIAELGAFRPQHFGLEFDGEAENIDALLVAAGVTNSYGGGLRICEGADPTDGLLDITVVGAVPRRDLVRVFPKLAKGTHVGHPAVTVYRAKRLSMASADLVSFADGERMGPLPVTVECVPGALTVFAPPPR